MKKEEIRKKLKEVLEEGDLDVDVHDFKSKEASRINNVMKINLASSRLSSICLFVIVSI